jgi:glutamine cyclotransferase
VRGWLEEPLAVLVLTQEGRPAAGVRVVFRVVQGEAAVERAVVRTDPGGLARTRVRFGDEPGRVRVEAAALLASAPVVAFELHAEVRPFYYGYEVLAVYPHDRDAFTQGLAVDGDDLFEGTGRRGASWLRRVDRATGAVLQQVDLADDYFGEGVTVFGDRIIQLTWREETGFVYDRDSFEPLGTFTYPHEGWGLTHDGTHLIVSDGTPTIRFWDPETFAEVRHIEVRHEGAPVTRLNELEYIDGEIYANVWQKNYVLRIDPATGEVTGWVDLSGLLTPQERAAADVLNGIAYDAVRGRLLVTGKLWPKLFEIRLVPEERLTFAR